MSDSFFLRWISPGSLYGVSLGQWSKLLSQNHWYVDPPYAGRAAVMTVGAALNLYGKVVEDIRFGKSLDRAAVHPPLFVLGVWRSGTTHLHNLLCQDVRFAFPTAFQTLNPHVFLSTERWFSPLQRPFFPATRPFDNMKFGIDEPWEDEFAIATMSGLSHLWAWVFPKQHLDYEKYIDFSETSEEEVCRWKQTLLYFVKKLSLKYDKPLVLKSPYHTARIRLLLELFPKAKFVYIHRHPHEVFASFKNMVRRATPLVAMQRFDVEELSGRCVPLYQTLTHRYLDERSLIADGNLVEVGFDELVRSPVSMLRRIYERLQLPAFDRTEPAIRDYVQSLAGYQKNVHDALDARTKSLLAREWNRTFREWGYESE